MTRTNILTSRDVQLIEFLKQGLTRLQIAKALNVKGNTACNYLSELRRKTNCLTDTSLIYKYDTK